MRELASLIGITICSKCGTRTKMKRTERFRRDHLAGTDKWIGYAICPKCGSKEGWSDSEEGGAI